MHCDATGATAGGEPVKLHTLLVGSGVYRDRRGRRERLSRRVDTSANVDRNEVVRASMYSVQLAEYILDETMNSS
jgi:hypothetical protein